MVLTSGQTGNHPWATCCGCRTVFAGPVSQRASSQSQHSYLGGVFVAPSLPVGSRPSSSIHLDSQYCAIRTCPPPMTSQRFVVRVQFWHDEPRVLQCSAATD